MREILFKAKRIDNGEWVEGHLLKVKKNYYICEKPYECMNGYSSLKGQHYGFGDFKFVDENTICQYTGLTDKNDNKIWENDIVKKVDTNALGYHRERICTVSWDDNGYWLLMTTLGDGYFIGEFRSEQLEVIGNIFDNPELLESGE